MATLRMARWRLGEARILPNLQSEPNHSLAGIRWGQMEMIVLTPGNLQEHGHFNYQTVAATSP